MKKDLKLIASLAVIFSVFLSAYSPSSTTKKTNKQPKIQAAILLDVSGSMSGLIEQAKAQLWNMVTTMGKVKCNTGIDPTIEIALYEYGRDNNDVAKGYIKQLSGFTNDLDSLSKILFSLRTNGGSEYCGHVIKTSLDELAWDNNAESYKVIFIAGNEDFLQGNIKYTEACAIANQKGVIVNTIYCGDRMQGIREHWNLLGECGNGSFTNINHNDKIDDIPTPYDSLLITMSSNLNNTYVAYNYTGAVKLRGMASVDQANNEMSKSAGIKRAKVKANSKVYNNATWDLVDAKEKDKNAIAKLDRAALPDSLKNKTTEELEKIVDEKAKQRSAAQKQIEELNAKRDVYIATERAKNATKATTNLETEVEKIIKEQVKRSNMTIQ
ncbi:MAG: hypothetical protein KA319_00085 [Ferruginibacter sp.]|nr:hypothetical protein [Ferruginibacter sp.]